jgi:hypothetical protein
MEKENIGDINLVKTYPNIVQQIGNNFGTYMPSL